ncbi:hypothetical protein GCM10027589_21430 [Actinocorallia lasiicapitis]
MQISTSEYKIRPIKARTRELLGYPHPARVPDGVFVEQAIGISTDEFTRAKDARVRYMRHTFPLLDLGWSRRDCLTYLEGQGWASTPKSACVGCPFHGNDFWFRLKHHSPAEWDDAVAFDAAIRYGHPRATSTGRPARHQFFLHRSCLPLDQAPIRTPDTGDPDGCSPFSCRDGSPAPGNRP